MEPTPQGTERWSTAVGGVVVPPLVSGTRVIVGGLDGSVHGLRLDRGDEVWVTDVRGPVTTDLVWVQGDMVAVQDGNDAKFLLGEDGTDLDDLLWTAAPAIALADDGVGIAVATYGPTSAAGEGGEELPDATWLCTVEAGVVSCVGSGRSGAIASPPRSTEAGALYGLDHALVLGIHAGDSSVELWSYPIDPEEAIVVQPAVVGNVAVAVGTHRSVIGVDLWRGTLQWEQQTEGVVAGAIGVVEDAVVVADVSGFVYRIDSRSGAVEWVFSAGAAIEGGVTVAGSVAYVATADHFLYAIDTATGAVDWQFDLGQPTIARPTLSVGVVFVATEAGLVLAIEPPDYEG